jgi:hypothetical protein
MLDDVRMGYRFARGFTAFLRRPSTSPECRRELADHLARRDAFLHMMARAVCGNPRSPYLDLLRRARIDYDHVARRVERQGVEAALAELYEAHSVTIT